MTLQFALLANPVLGATITVDLSQEQQDIDDLKIEIECEDGFRQSGVLSETQSVVFSLPGVLRARERCTVSAETVIGSQVTYSSDGGSLSDANENGCVFEEIEEGDANFCLVLLEDEITDVRVYVRWIGADGTELPVEVHLFCDGMVEPFEPAWVSQGGTGGWKLPDVPEGGIYCDVIEVRREEFLADMSDCERLQVMPGTTEECTLVNTKVVKRIEMLNRYGKIVMVIAFLGVGLLATRKFS